VYDGYPTSVPVTPSPGNSEPSPTVAATAIPQLVFPPLPTATPRPALPSVPANLKPKKSDVLQQAFDTILSDYYQPLSSADVYEVGLIGLRNALREAGVNQPDVPIPDFKGDPKQDWQTFLQAFTITLDRYGSKLSEDKLAYAAIQHSTELMGECQVSQTTFVPPDQAQAYSRARLGQNQYIGLGVNVVPLDTTSGYYITRIVSGTPAEQGGLKLGDAIVAINGQDVTKLDAGQVVSLLQGRNATAGSKVSLGLRRAGTGKQETIEIARATIQTPSFEPRLLTDNIAYIRFNSFPFVTSDAALSQYAAQFDRLINDFNTRGVKGYVLDLRGTSLGYLITVQTLLSRFVTGQDLMYLVTRDPQGQRGVATVASTPNVKAVDKPIAVLVDSGTSNEAEIFAQVIKKKKKGSLFGVPTAGCPVASIPTQLPDNSILNLSAYRSLDDANDPTSWTDSLEPDTLVRIDRQSLSQGLDAQLEKAVTYIKSQ